MVGTQRASQVCHSSFRRNVNTHVQLWHAWTENVPYLRYQPCGVRYGNSRLNTYVWLLGSIYILYGSGSHSAYQCKLDTLTRPSYWSYEQHVHRGLAPFRGLLKVAPFIDFTSLLDYRAKPVFSRRSLIASFSVDLTTLRTLVHISLIALTHSLSIAILFHLGFLLHSQISNL